MIYVLCYRYYGMAPDPLAIRMILQNNYRGHIVLLVFWAQNFWVLEKFIDFDPPGHENRSPHGLEALGVQPGIHRHRGILRKAQILHLPLVF